MYCAGVGLLTVACLTSLLTELKGKLQVTACVSSRVADLQGQTSRCTSD